MRLTHGIQHQAIHLIKAAPSPTLLHVLNLWNQVQTIRNSIMRCWSCCFLWYHGILVLYFVWMPLWDQSFHYFTMSQPIENDPCMRHSLAAWPIGRVAGWLLASLSHRVDVITFYSSLGLPGQPQNVKLNVTSDSSLSVRFDGADNAAGAVVTRYKGINPSIHATRAAWPKTPILRTYFIPLGIWLGKACQIQC